MKTRSTRRRVVTRRTKKFLLKGHARPLRQDDFRSARLVIPPGAFAIVKKFRVVLDPIDLKTWTELQAAPDDVCLQTTEYHGSALRLQRELHSEWIHQTGFAADGSLEQDALAHVAFEAEAEWQASAYASAHGFYRQAVETLRAALERTLIALRYQDEQSDLRFRAWLRAGEPLPFQPACDQILSGNRTVRNLNKHLMAAGLQPFIWRRGERVKGWVGQLYEDLCRFSHCRPGHASADLWRGPGPVYDPKAFALTYDLYRQTAVACWRAAKMARPSLNLPGALRRAAGPARKRWGRTAMIALAFLRQGAAPNAARTRPRL